MPSNFARRLPWKARRLLCIMVDTKPCHGMEEDGGPGSGNFGHKGRPGLRGGSGKGGGSHYRGGNKRIRSKELQSMLSQRYEGRSQAREIAQDYPRQSRLFAHNMEGIKYGQKGHEAVYSYNYHGDTLINNMLRGKKPRSYDQQKEWQNNQERTRRYIDEMTEVMSQNKLRHDAVVYRGIATFDGVKDALGLNLDAASMKGMLENHDFVDSLVGYTFCDKAFVSTSIEKDVIYRGNFAKACEMEIHCPKGTEGIYQGDQFRITDEHEYTMQRGTQFVITGATVVQNQFGVKRLKLDLSVMSQEPDDNIPELQKAFGDTHPEITKAAVEKKPLPTETLIEAFPQTDTGFLRQINQLQKAPDSIEKHDVAVALLENGMAFGDVDPIEAAELLGYCRGYDMSGQVDSFMSTLKEINEEKEKYSGPDYADARSILQKQNPRLTAEQIPFIVGIDDSINRVKERIERDERQYGPDGVSKLAVKRLNTLQKQREHYIAEAIRRNAA